MNRNRAHETINSDGSSMIIERVDGKLLPLDEREELAAPNLKPINGAVLFANGQIAVFDEGGQQIAELQSSPLILWAQHAEAAGYDPCTARVEMVGQGRFARIVRTDDGFNYRFE